MDSPRRREGRRRGPPRDALGEIYAVLAGVAGTRRLTPEEHRIIEICESAAAQLEESDPLFG